MSDLAIELAITAVVLRPSKILDRLLQHLTTAQLQNA
jgi:hypothetical protein